MITFERTTDSALLKSILLRYPGIWEAMRDDFSPPAEEYVPYEGETLWYVLAREGAEPFGFFALFPESMTCMQLHTVMPLNSRAHNAITGLIAWLWRQIPELARITTSVPACNDVALRFGLRAGLSLYGVNPCSFKKGGKLWDQILLGVTRPEGV
jgi:hypothetical protein